MLCLLCGLPLPLGHASACFLKGMQKHSVVSGLRYIANGGARFSVFQMLALVRVHHLLSSPSLR